MKKWVMAFALAMISSAASAGDWRLLSVGKAGAIAVDMDGIRASGTKRVGWTAMILPLRTSDIDYVLVRYEWDCDADTSTQLGWVAYLEDGMLVDRDETRKPTSVVPPDSNEVHVLNAVCRGEFQVPDSGWNSVPALLRDFRTTPPS